MRCRRPARVCYCAQLVSLPTRTRVVILQHPRERDMPIGTAHMASLCLPNSELHVGTGCSPALLRALSDPERPAVLLYPGDGARDLKRDPPSGPCTLVVLDGTWWQARKLLRTNPELAALPRVAFTPEKASEYRIRKEPQDDYVSTIEALAEVLPALEGGSFESLLTPFRAMIDTQLHCEATLPKAHGGPSRKRLKLRKNSYAKLRERAADLVCVTVEASAWARRRGESAARDELIYFAAHRVATGATLTLAAQPERELAPNALGQTELTQEILARALPRDFFLQEMDAFLTESDAICTWGGHTLDLCRLTIGRTWPTCFDLRQIARDRAQGNVGSMTQVLTELGEPLPPPIGEGRAGTRLGQLSAIVRAFCR